MGKGKTTISNENDQSLDPLPASYVDVLTCKAPPKEPNETYPDYRPRANAQMLQP